MLSRLAQRFGPVCAGGLLLAALAVGCGGKHVTIADTFPKGSYASPWVLQGAIWSGTLAQAAEALGDEAAQWEGFRPERVWLGVYRHDTRSADQLIVRAWAFASPTQARAAFEHFRPKGAGPLEAGEEGCWTADGILVLWGRMVFDMFGTGPSATAHPEQAVYLLAFFEKKMPPGLPGDPR